MTDTDDKLPGDITFKNVILMTCIIKDDDFKNIFRTSIYFTKLMGSGKSAFVKIGGRW